MLYREVVNLWKNQKSMELISNFFLKFTYCSIKIDNEETRLRDVESIFKGEKVIGFRGDKKTIREIENHEKICESFSQISNENNAKLSIELIKRFHYILMKDCFTEELLLKGERPGEFRRNANTLELEGNLNLLFKNINSIELNEDNILECISYFSCEFEKLHPFKYGNGILVRILINYLLIGNNFLPIIIFYNDKEKYYLALKHFNERQEIDKMVNFLDDQAYKTWVKNYNIKLKSLRDFLD